MSHSDIQALLEGFTLDILTPQETKAVRRHLNEGCAVCGRIVQEYDCVLGLLGLTCEPKTPPARVRQSILNAISQSDGDEANSNEKGAPAPDIVLAGEGNWQGLFPGIGMKSLFRDSQTGYQTALLKMAAGSRLPRHLHVGDEETFVVEGSCINNNIHFSKGDYWHVDSGRVHEATDTEEGCTLLVRYLKVKFDLTAASS